MVHLFSVSLHIKWFLKIDSGYCDITILKHFFKSGFSLRWQVIKLFVGCCCSAVKSCLTLCYPMCFSTPGSSILHYLPELAQIHVHWLADAISPSHPRSPHSSFPASGSFPISSFRGSAYFSFSSNVKL